MPDDSWSFSDDDLDRMLDQASDDGGGDSDSDGFATFDEIGDMCRRIAVQYVDILASYAALTFQGKGSPSSREAVVAAAQALKTLAEASKDTALIPLSTDLLAIATQALGSRRAVLQQRRALRAWLADFVAYLPAEAQPNLRQIIEYDFRTQPLLRELSGIRGIGAKRLQSLYTAGLFEAQTLSTARPDEVVAATGIPARLAEEVVATAAQFAAQHRQRTVESLRRMVAEFARTVRAQGINGDQDAHLIKMARESLEELRAILMEPAP